MTQKNKKIRKNLKSFKMKLKI